MIPVLMLMMLTIRYSYAVGCAGGHDEYGGEHGDDVIVEVDR